MARTSNIFARVEPEIKEQAESVLNQLGIPMSNAVGMFLRQVVMQKGIPFEMKLPSSRPLVLEEMTKEQLDAALSEGVKDIEMGNVKTAGEVEAEIHRLYGV
ncbi:MAG: type II toxin-antitoxin system RelB/DinJ family antitoxin [Eubacterium sp.]|nr:type II toxin-antitoxin system RelB/DinJ family antitoxin [Eubacterium sp.]